MNVCERIDKILLDRGMSRRKLALNAGIPPTTFQSAMARGTNLSLDMLQKIADALGVDVNYLLNGQTLEERNAAYLESKNARWVTAERWANGKERVVAACNVLNENGTQLLADIAEAMTEESTLRQLDKQPIKKDKDKK